MAKVRIDPADLELRPFAVYVREQGTPRIEARLADGFMISASSRAWIRHVLRSRASVRFVAATDSGVAIEFDDLTAAHSALTWFEPLVSGHVRPLVTPQPRAVEHDLAALERAAIAFVERNPRCSIDACTASLDCDAGIAAEIIERLVATGRLIDHARDEPSARK